MDESEIYVQEIQRARVNLYKLLFEEMGYDLGPTVNQMEYRNYLVEDPINFYNGSVYDTGYDQTLFGSAGGGKLTVPPGFYSDQVLFNFLSHAEGNVGMLWVTTYKGDEVARGCGINGWDFAGGVHTSAIANAIGVSASDFASMVTIDKSSPFSRKAMGGEITQGAAWGWATSPIKADSPYWQKLIPYYRDAMIWAWHQPIIQSVKEPAERLARMHSINWWGYHYIKGFHGGTQWPHRYQSARGACAGMQNFA